MGDTLDSLCERQIHVSPCNKIGKEESECERNKLLPVLVGRTDRTIALAIHVWYCNLHLLPVKRTLSSLMKYYHYYDTLSRRGGDERKLKA